MFTHALGQAPPAPILPITKPGTEVIVDILHEQSVDTIFGYTGASVMPLFDTIFRAILAAARDAIRNNPKL